MLHDVLQSNKKKSAHRGDDDINNSKFKTQIKCSAAVQVISGKCSQDTSQHLGSQGLPFKE